MTDAQKRSARHVANAGRLDHDGAGTPTREAGHSTTSSDTKPSSVARHGTIGESMSAARVPAVRRARARKTGFRSFFPRRRTAPERGFVPDALGWTPHEACPSWSDILIILELRYNPVKLRRCLTWPSGPDICISIYRRGVMAERSFAREVEDLRLGEGTRSAARHSRHHQKRCCSPASPMSAAIRARRSRT